MGTFNKVILMGNITRDIEVRHLPSQMAIATIGLAMNRKWKDATTGEMREEVTFVDCDAWGKTAENIAKFFSKGKPIFIEGRLKLDTWKDKTDGSNRSKLKVVVESFEFVESKAGGGGGGNYEGGGGGGNAQTRPQGNARPAAAAAPQGQSYEEIQPDDIPF